MNFWFFYEKYRIITVVLSSFHKSDLSNIFKNWYSIYKDFLKINNIIFVNKSIIYKKRREALLKSPHVNKKAQQHIEAHVYHQSYVFKLKKKQNFLFKIIINSFKNYKHVKIFYK